jgi:hypothetical protein
MQFAHHCKCQELKVGICQSSRPKTLHFKGESEDNVDLGCCWFYTVYSQMRGLWDLIGNGMWSKKFSTIMGPEILHKKVTVNEGSEKPPFFFVIC